MAGVRYYPPPPPFVGGRQPLEGNRLTAAIGALPDAMPSRALITAAVGIAIAASVVAPLPAQAGPRKMAPQLLAVQEDNPPFGLLETNVEPWVGKSSLPQRGAAVAPLISVAAPSVDNPVPRYPDVVSIASWRLPPPLPQQDSKLAPALLAVAEDNPPFGLLETHLGPWLGPAPLPIVKAPLSPALSVTQVDSPTGRPRHAAHIVAMWPKPVTLPQQRSAQIAPFVTTQVDSPIGKPRDAVSIAAWSQSVLPQQRDIPVAPFAGVAADIPPQRSIQTLPAPSVASLPQRGAAIAPLLTVAQVDNPPSRSAHGVRTALLAWQPAPPLPQRSGKLNPQVSAVAEDNPPFGLLETNIEPWKTTAALPAIRRNGVTQSQQVDDAPLTRKARINASIISSWQPVFPQIITVYVTLQEGATQQVDDPPFNSRRLELGEWFKPKPPLPQRAPQFPQQLDNPPGEPVSDIEIVRGKWWFPQTPTRSNPALLAVPADTVISVRAEVNANIVLASWRSDGRLPQQRQRVAPQGTQADNPLVRSNPPLPVQPVAGLPQRGAQIAPLLAAVDNPQPRSVRPLPVAQVVPLPQRGAQIAPLLAVAQVDSPIAQSDRARLSAILPAWQISGRLPQQRFNLDPALGAVQVDNPPQRAVFTLPASQVAALPQRGAAIAPLLAVAQVDNPPQRSVRPLPVAQAVALPQRGAAIAPLLAVAQVDSPAGQIDPARLNVVLPSWRIVAQLPQRQILLAQAGPDTVLSTRPWQSRIASAWRLEIALPQRGAFTPQQVIAGPPKLAHPEIYAAWVPPAPFPQPRRVVNPALEDVQVDNPPPRSLSAYQSLVESRWRPLEAVYTFKRKDPIAGVTVPPFKPVYRAVTVVAAWHATTVTVSYGADIEVTAASAVTMIHEV